MAISEKRRTYNRKWHEEHGEQIKAYRDRTKEQRNARRRELYRQDEWRREEACVSARQYHKDHPLAKKASHYGISRGEVEDMLNGGCDICGAGLFDVSITLRIDHDHQTGRVRGALCNSCNLAIGHLYNDPALAAAALRYLLKAGEDSLRAKGEWVDYA